MSLLKRLKKSVAKDKMVCHSNYCFRRATKFLRMEIKGTKHKQVFGYCDRCAVKVHEELMNGALYNNYEEDSYKPSSHDS